MPTVIDPTAYIIGAAEVYYRAVGSTAAWTSIGATVDDVVFRATRSVFNPSENFNGILGLIREMDYVSQEGAEVEFTMPEMAGPKLALAMPGAGSTTLATTDAGGGGSTTSAAAAAVGDTAIKVTAITNFTAGDYIKIDSGGNIEYRVVDVVGTAGAGGTGLQFRDPLRIAHSSGVAVVETVGDGKTEITPGTTRRFATADYNDWALVAQSPAAYYELVVYNAISTTESAEITFGDETMAGIRVTLGARKNGSDLSAPMWKLRVPPAA